MIRLYDFDEVRPEEILNRDIRAEADVEATVDAIIADVRARGDAALIEYAAKFDHAELTDVRVSQAEIEEAFAELEKTDPEFITTLKMAAENIRHFHEQQLHKNFVVNDKPGIVLGQKYTPIEKAGVYVPGGTAAYPSTVLMDVIPAKVAGVSEIVMTTPAGKDGKVNPVILAAAATAGVTKIFKTGGAQAVAALAYGTETIPRADKITGPGNAFVAAAKQIVSGDVGIDMVAGPSEVCVLADATAKPMVVAADLMAQAEHDPLAACYLVTCDEQFAREVEAGIDILVAQSPRAEITRASLDNEGTIVVAADMAAAVEAVNTVAPEHLELHCKDAMGLLGGIRNAGAIFVGAWSSEPLGDYVAGPNHTLPTGGTAMFSNPLSVEEFVKRSSVICYTPEGLLSDAPATQRLAEAEGLWAHALSAALRRRVLEQGEDAVSAESLAAADLTKVAWPGDAVATVAEGVDLAAAGSDGAGATGEEA
ncbi:MAG TPA: histidinol dehydrogenase [Collinsella aerofaciens]|nr:histidinol dehydrogenase [Collinsella aerofaciens]